MTPDIATNASMEVQFAPEERCLRHVRLSIVSFIMVMTEDRAMASRVAMSATELLENAVKYSTSDRIGFRLMVRSTPEGTGVRLETENEAPPEKIATLQQIVRDVGEGEGVDAYMRYLKAAATRSESQSQLGLARIRYEGEMSLRADVNGKRLLVIAECAPRAAA